MLTITPFTVNPFGVNMYVLSDEKGHAVIVDAACYFPEEKQKLKDYINQKQLKVQAQWATHTHLDHMLGSSFVEETWKVELFADPNGQVFIDAKQHYADMFGFEVDHVAPISHPVKDGDQLTIGNSSIEVISAYGHADGSICFYAPAEKFIITGDVLFNGSVGRSDIPTGDHELLIRNIKEKLLILPDETLVYPGHGPHSTIGFEKKNNPFLS